MDLQKLKVGQSISLMNTEDVPDDEEVMHVTRRSGSFYGECGKYDFETVTATEAQVKLTRWGYTTVL